MGSEEEAEQGPSSSSLPSAKGGADALSLSSHTGAAVKKAEMKPWFHSHQA